MKRGGGVRGAKLDRQLEILNMLSKGWRLTCEKLAFEFGVTRETIRNDLLELSITYPIESFRGNGGGIELGKGYVITGYAMKTSRLKLIVEGLRLLQTQNDDEEIAVLISMLTTKNREE